MTTPTMTADKIRAYDATERAERAARGCVRCLAPLGSCSCDPVDDATVALLLAGYSRLCDRHVHRACELLGQLQPQRAGEVLADARCVTTTDAQVVQVQVLQAAVDAALAA